MYYANCEWYVDMGEYNKPLCERNSLRPAKCSECPVYIRSIEEENAKLRELVRDMYMCAERECMCHGCPLRDDERCDFEGRMAALGVDADDINQNNFQSTKKTVDSSMAREVVE